MAENLEKWKDLITRAGGIEMNRRIVDAPSSAQKRSVKAKLCKRELCYLHSVEGQSMSGC